MSLCARRCLGASSVSVFSNCAFFMVESYCMGICGLFVAGSLNCRGCRHEKFQVVTGTIFSAAFEVEEKTPRPTENPPSSANRPGKELSWSTRYCKGRAEFQGLYVSIGEVPKS